MRRDGAPMRYVLVVLIALVGCDDVGGADDMAACVPDAGAGAAHACGPLVCAADEFCFFESFGACAPPDLANADGGSGVVGPCGQYSCAKLPASCGCTQLCGVNGQPGPTGCLHAVPACQYANGCWLRDSIITCGDQ